MPLSIAHDLPGGYPFWGCIGFSMQAKSLAYQECKCRCNQSCYLCIAHRGSFCTIRSNMLSSCAFKAVPLVKYLAQYAFGTLLSFGLEEPLASAMRLYERLLKLSIFRLQDLLRNLCLDPQASDETSLWRIYDLVPFHSSEDGSSETCL
ncbi:hypothetical protein VNO77_25717 [Canavalia gladiata]|uniref:Uncharacterized protein n=1 Tax=Canavalia gladiata TaxID=3824 RepID=A0AAN9Q8Z1_CANGL